MGLLLMKFVTWVLSPLTISVFLILLGILSRRWKKWGWLSGFSFWFSFVWLWVWASPWFYLLIFTPLENAYPPQPVESLPKADAIVVLGGCIAPATPPATLTADLYSSADRGWQVARCYHAGKAPKVLFSGIGEGPGLEEFLLALGVPREAIILESDSRNTYENAKFTEMKLKELNAKRVILITSSWHMARSVAVFKRFGVEVIPCGCDYEARVTRATNPWWKLLGPNAESLSRNNYAFKEYLGRLAYWLYGK